MVESARRRPSSLVRVALVALAVRGLCLVAFLAESTQANVESYADFVCVGPGESRAERLQRIDRDLTERLAPFDGQFYLDIARNGYRRLEAWPHANYAFFPLYPLVLRVLDGLGGPTVLLAALLNVLSSSAAAALLWDLSERLGLRGWIAVALFLAWPGSAFHVLIYPESLFLCLSLSTAILSLSGRSFPAALPAFSGALLRPQGLLLALLFIPAAAKASPPREATRFLLAALSPLLGATLHYAYIALISGEPLAYFQTQAEWGRHLHPLGVLQSLSAIARLKCLPLDGASALLGLFFLPKLFRLPPAFFLFGAAGILLPLATGTPLSMCRFVSTNFPLFLAGAGVLEGRRPALHITVLLLAVLQAWTIKRLAAWEFAG